MAGLLDVCRFVPTLGGTTDWTFSAAVVGYQSPAAAGAVNGTVYRYRAESADLSQWEIGYGAYTAAGSVFARTTVLFNSAGTTAKISFSTVPQVAIVALAEDFREQLVANRTYFVSTTGNDSNNGLTSGTAFLTIQKAINVVAGLDISTFNVTISVADGTYAGAALVSGPWLGSGVVTLQGNVTTPANCIISTVATCVVVLNGGALTVSGFKFASSSAHGLSAQYGGTITVSGALNYGACASDHNQALDGGKILFNVGYTISGNAGSSHWDANGPGSVIRQQSGGTVTITGTPSINTFASARFNAAVLATGPYSGAGTGTKYYADFNAVINSGGVTFPVPTAGSTATGGQFA
jgi:hypothetical protein